MSQVLTEVELLDFLTALFSLSHAFPRAFLQFYFMTNCLAPKGHNDQNP